MKWNIFLFFCFELLIQTQACCNEAAAQDTLQRTHDGDLNKNGEQEFNDAVKRHREELQNLIAIKTNGQLPGLYSNDNVTAQNIISTLQTSYRDRTALLFYNYEETSLKMWLVTRQGLMAYSNEQIPEKKLTGVINDLRRALRIDSLQQKSRAPHLLDETQKNGSQIRGGTLDSAGGIKVNLPDAIEKLTNILLPDTVAAQLAAVNALIIVPVLDLGTVPFAILKPFKTNASLIDKMSLSVAPSLFDVMVEKSEKWSPVFIQPLIVGNPKFTNKTNWVFPSLQGAEKEVIAISKLVHGPSPLIGSDATKQAVLARVENADFLYFATHGISDIANSRTKSFIVLGETENDTGLWTMEEILQKHYKARLAVLSACQTGLGETYKGGIMALGRTFQVAGVPEVAMSLWSVDDAATSQLMQAFVRRLQIEQPSEALRQAMLETKNMPEYADPSKWASFVLFGTPK